MSDASVRRILRIGDQLDHLVAASRQESLDKIRRGSRRWADIDHALADWMGPWREEAMAALPVCVARRRADPGLSYWHDGAPQIAMMLAHPPGEPLAGELQDAVQQVQTRWRTEPEATYRDWAACRLVFGADGGEELRRCCWTLEDGGWVLSDEVMDAATGHEHIRSDLMLLSPADAQRLEARMESFNPAVLLFLLSMMSATADLPVTVLTPLELAVLIDPSTDPAWLPRTGWAALRGESDEEVTSSPTPCPYSAAEVALARVYLRGTAKFWHGRDDERFAVQNRWLATPRTDNSLAQTEPT